MTYTLRDGNVTLEMSLDQYEQLTLMLGFAVGLAHREGDLAQFYRWLQFVNELNATNPRFRPYAIPEEYAR